MTRKDKPETVETWGTQDTRDSGNMRYTRQTRDSGNMGYTGHRTPDSGNMGYTRHRTPETVETWGT